jgi:hypothetical protein
MKKNHGFPVLSLSHLVTNGGQRTLFWSVPTPLLPSYGFVAVCVFTLNELFK